MSRQPLRATTTGIALTTRYFGMWLGLYAALAAAQASVLGALLFLWLPLGTWPAWDAAIDGDLLSFLALMQSGQLAIAPLVAMMALIASTWLVASWFLHAGVLHVYCQEPTGRLATAKAFGEGGARLFFAYCWLDAVAAALLLLPFIGIGTVLAWVAQHAVTALNLPDLLVPLIALVPFAWLWLCIRTAVDLVRIELAIEPSRDASHAVSALWRNLLNVLRMPQLCFVALGWRAAPWIVAGGLAIATLPHPLFGAGGAMALFVLRQGTVLLRLGCTLARYGTFVAIHKRTLT